MLQTVLVSTVLVAIGWCLYVRRRSWRFRWDGVLTLAVALQAAGFVLCMPAQGRWIGRALFGLTGITHIRDYIGGVCYLAATCAVVYGVAYRLTSAEQLERSMRFAEIPATVAALVMLVCLMSSRSLRVRGVDDFFQVPCDGWLTLYWLTYLGTCVYLLNYLVRLLLVVRQDPRSRVSADAYICAVAAGNAAIVAQMFHVLLPRLGVSSLWVWMPLCVASALAALGIGWSWRRRVRVELATWGG